METMLFSKDTIKVTESLQRLFTIGSGAAGGNPNYNLLFYSLRDIALKMDASQEIGTLFGRIGKLIEKLQEN